LHEYEALLFSAPDDFARAIHYSQLEPRFQSIRDSFPTPEDIDDGPLSSPSKRVLAAYPQYRKVLHVFLQVFRLEYLAPCNCASLPITGQSCCRYCADATGVPAFSKLVRAA